MNHIAAASIRLLERHRFVCVLSTLLIVIAVRFAVLEFNPSAFMVHGQMFSLGDAPVNIAVVHESGYDGQFFGRLALDPFNSAQDALGMRLDRPAYRYQRIIYPATAWLLAFGQPEFVPATLILVNLMSLFAAVFCLDRIARILGFQTSQGLQLMLVVLLPGLMMGLARDLAEPMAFALLLVSLLAFLKNHFFAYGLLASLCVLCRETSLVIFGAVGIAYLFTKGREIKFEQFLLLSCPAVVFVLWQGVIWSRFGMTSFAAAPENFTTPFSGLYQYVKSIPGMDMKEVVLQGVYTVWLLIVAFYAVKSLTVKSEHPLIPALMIGWVLWSILALCFSQLIWEDDWSFCRVLGDWLLCSYILILASYKNYPRILLLPTLVVCSGTILRVVLKI